MTSLGDAVASAIDTNWNVGLGGTKPAPIAYIVDYSEKDPNLTDLDAIFIWYPKPRFVRVNDNFRNEFYDVRIVIETITSDARQEEIHDEVDRIFAQDGVLTGVTQYFITSIGDVSERAHGVDGAKFKTEIRLEVQSLLTSGATAYGSATTTDITTDTLTVNTSATIASPTFSGPVDLGGSALTLDGNITSSGRMTWTLGMLTIVAGGDGSGNLGVDSLTTPLIDYGGGDIDIQSASTSTSIDEIAAALMIGAANAAWVPFIVTGERLATYTQSGGAYIENVGADNMDILLQLPKELLRGSLKLYVDDIRIEVLDADVGDYINTITLYGYAGSSRTTIEQETDDKQIIETVTWARTATDVSGYNSVWLRLECVNANAADLKITSIEASCYYA